MILGVGKMEQLEDSSIYGTTQVTSANRLSTSLFNNFFFLILNMKNVFHIMTYV